MEVRNSITNILAEQGFINPSSPMKAISLKPIPKLLKRNIAQNNEQLHELLYKGSLVSFFELFFGGKVRYLDFTGFRTVSPGLGTYVHCDSVYMGRGTPRLLTAWVPIGAVPLELGGLMILEKSHKIQLLHNNYCYRDVDTYCVNRANAEKYATNKKMWNGALTKNPVRLGKIFNRRWLTENFGVGDLLIFTLYTVHGSLDNQTNFVRISADPRFQLASEKADHRYVGKNPIANSISAKRGRVC
jgi:hypothetical protein